MVKNGEGRPKGAKYEVKRPEGPPARLLVYKYSMPVLAIFVILGLLDPMQILFCNVRLSGPHCMVQQAEH